MRDTLTQLAADRLAPVADPLDMTEVEFAEFVDEVLYDTAARCARSHAV